MSRGCPPGTRSNAPSHIYVPSPPMNKWAARPHLSGGLPSPSHSARNRPCQSSSAQDHGIYFNFYFDYGAYSAQYGGSHPRGHAWIGVGNTGSNSHMPSETSNCIAGFGVDTWGPDDPTTAYSSVGVNSAGTTFVRPGASYSTVAVYVWS